MADSSETYRGVKITVRKYLTGRVQDIKLDMRHTTVYMTPKDDCSEQLAFGAAREYIDKQYKRTLN